MARPSNTKPERKPRSAINEVVTREFTINLHRSLMGIKGKHRAPRAIDVIRKFAQRNMQTKDVRVDVRLNKFIWSHGIR